MTTKPTGGSAFPTAEQTRGDGTIIQFAESGMTLRQWYAGQALPWAIEAAMKQWTRDSAAPASTAARWAFEVADAMIAEGEK